MFFSIVLLILTCWSTNQYNLDGVWHLGNHQQIKLNQTVEVQFQFKQRGTQDSIIRADMIVSACYDLSYSIEIHHNFIKIMDQRILGLPRRCQKGQMSAIRPNINKIQKYMIKESTLLLIGEDGSQIFILQKKQEQRQSINGKWLTINKIQNKKGQQIYVNNTHATLCNGNGIAQYKIIKKDQIIFTILRSRGCSKQQMEILQNLDLTIFFRIKDRSYLELYDTNLNKVLQASRSKEYGQKMLTSGIIKINTMDQNKIEAVNKQNSIENQTNQNKQQTKKQAEQVQVKAQPKVQIIEPAAQVQVKAQPKVQIIEPAAQVQVKAQPKVQIIEPAAQVQVKAQPKVQIIEPAAQVQVKAQPKVQIIEPAAQVQVKAQPKVQIIEPAAQVQVKAQPKVQIIEPAAQVQVKAQPKVQIIEPAAQVQVKAQPKVQIIEPAAQVQVKAQPKVQIIEPAAQVQVKAQPKVQIIEPAAQVQVKAQPKVQIIEPAAQVQVKAQPKVQIIEPAAQVQVKAQPKVQIIEPAAQVQVKAQPKVQIIEPAAQVQVKAQPKVQIIEPAAQVQVKAQPKVSIIEPIKDNHITSQQQQIGYNQIRPDILVYDQPNIYQAPLVNSKAESSIHSQIDLQQLSSLESIQNKWFIGFIKDRPLKDFIQYFIIITANKIIVYGGCNVMFSSYILKGNRINFGKLSSTRKICPIDNDPILIQHLIKDTLYIEHKHKQVHLYNDQFIRTISLKIDYSE